MLFTVNSAGFPLTISLCTTKTFKKFYFVDIFVQQKKQQKKKQPCTCLSCWLYSTVGWHLLLQPSFVVSQPMWLCWSLWYEEHARATRWANCSILLNSGGGFWWTSLFGSSHATVKDGVQPNWWQFKIATKSYKISSKLHFYNKKSTKNKCTYIQNVIFFSL